MLCGSAVTLPRNVRVDYIGDVTFGRISRGLQRQERRKRYFRKTRVNSLL